LNSLKEAEHLRYENQKVIQKRRSSPENHNRNRTTFEALLMRQILVNRDQNGKAGLFRRGEQAAIGEPL